MESVAKYAFALILIVSTRFVLAESPADYPWTSADSQNVSTVSWNTSEIGDFLAEVTGAEDQLAISDFRFADLFGNGNLELVASADVSGRAFFNNLLITQRSGSSFTEQTISVANLESLAEVLADLNGDGQFELVVPVALTPYLGGTIPQVRWTAIYTWTGAIYKEHTAGFAAWYTANILPRLQQELDVAQQSDDPVAITLAQLQLDKAIRTSGGDPNEGLVHAQALITSSDPNLRIWGAFALADIGTAEALETLTILLQDPDPEVAIYAKSTQALPRLGDLDHDGDVDRDDVNILLKDRNKPVAQSACGTPCDLDGDGTITALDARKLVLLCTRPNCATQ